jgi:hypothetical protein
MRKTAGTVVGVVRGVRTAIETFLADQPTNGRPAAGKANGHQPGSTASSSAPNPAPPSVEPF